MLKEKSWIPLGRKHKPQADIKIIMEQDYVVRGQVSRKIETEWDQK